MIPTRAERNNNPGNIRHGSNWLGLADEQPDPDFCTFEKPEYGFRAMAKILRVYQQKGIDTVRGIISHWAPASENNTAAYISAVAGRMKVDPDTHLDASDPTQLAPLMDAITYHESGRNIWPRTVLDAGMSLAGVGA